MKIGPTDTNLDKCIRTEAVLVDEKCIETESIMVDTCVGTDAFNFLSHSDHAYSNLTWHSAAEGIIDSVNDAEPITTSTPNVKTVKPVIDQDPVLTDIVTNGEESLRNDSGSLYEPTFDIDTSLIDACESDDDDDTQIGFSDDYTFIIYWLSLV